MDTETIADKYEILAELGRGGMGRVYKVLHRSLNKVYALKILREHLVDDESLIARFQNEARIMASLHHANIIQVFDIDRDGDRHYFVMEYIEGQTLGEVLRKRAPLPLSDISTISRQIAQALDYAHQQQPPIIHRDIKPSNIMLEAGTGRVVVTDFGIAKLLDAERTRHTLTGFTVGTPSYAAPEQLLSGSECRNTDWLSIVAVYCSVIKTNTASRANRTGTTASADRISAQTATTNTAACNHQKRAAAKGYRSERRRCTGFSYRSC